METTKFGTALSHDVAYLPGLDVNDGSQEIQSIFKSLVEIGKYELFYCLLIIVALVFLIMVVLQTVVRAAQLVMTAVSGSFMALGLTDPDSQMFQSWWRELLSISLSHGIQLFMLKVSFYALMFKTDGYVIGNLLMFCAAIWVTYTSPTILKQYMYSSGVGRAATGATRSITRMVMSRAFIRGR
ncbi:conjugal transfer protein TrbL family protein [Paenibacillus sp. LPE1-1-1.1]|uniref:conjugal transfer protein TrbL family protein n=1 Tax=Paenibacillus sp. LPE1-1-1.1 TaxID=3135230 RepID=UPI00343C5E04